jgi:5'-3' exonuclease
VIILVDYNQIVLATLFASVGNHTNADIDENMIRHMLLNSLRHNRKKFTNDYGELVICTDGKNSWRKDVFPYYKANRKKGREESELDWQELFRIINLLREELQEYFPYKVLHFDRLEADDIIGILCHEYGRILKNDSESILILSGDKDYVQLQKYANVDQYNPVLKKWVKEKDPEQFLMEHIIRGDGGDGVPNILSADNSIVIGERQKSLTKKRIDTLMLGPSQMDTLTQTRYYRNKMMIDLTEIPEKFKEQVLSEFHKEKDVGRTKLIPFFVEKKLKNLFESVGDF